MKDAEGAMLNKGENVKCSVREYDPFLIKQNGQE
jgi:hypothetical protein